MYKFRISRYAKNTFIFATLPILLSLITACGNSNWTRVATESSGTLYVDHSKTEKAGTRTTVTHMLDLSSPRTIGVVSKFTYLSSISIEQYDCAEHKSRSLKMDFFDGSMGQGSNVNSVRPDFWLPRNRNLGSIEELWKIACR
ncbi:surface-adhesin E family protein [Limnohabitans sp. 2KL-1]|uniref:surface-adhesin E family protein n=1 Tax=Limnohabitans sp. 2KL-1 TaxID=1100699 RepID=UPI0035143738